LVSNRELFSNAYVSSFRYFFYLMNRPVLVLKCEQGFVGYRAGKSGKLECNKAHYELIVCERADKGQIHFKG
jgi:fascin 1/2